jgi:uncharacterized protein (TIGR03000 family)
MPSNRSLSRFLIACACLVLAAAPALAQSRQKEYARLRIYLPSDDTRLVVDGQETKQTGSLRTFRTPPLETGKKYYYILKWTYNKDGKDVTKTKEVYFTAGDNQVVDLREDINPKKGEDANPKKAEGDLDVQWVPSPPEVVDKMLEMAAILKDDVVYDLGCGDGRIVIAAAKKGCKAVGFDLDPKRIAESRENVKKDGLEKLVTIEQKDLFKVDLKPANVVTLYLLPDVNVRLIPQLEKLEAGSRVVSHEFDIKGMKPTKVETVKAKDGREHKIYLWIMPFLKEKGVSSSFPL